jgi:hypothetical protein
MNSERDLEHASNPNLSNEGTQKEYIERHTAIGDAHSGITEHLNLFTIACRDIPALDPMKSNVHHFARVNGFDIDDDESRRDFGEMITYVLQQKQCSNPRMMERVKLHGFTTVKIIFFLFLATKIGLILFHKRHPQVDKTLTLIEAFLYVAIGISLIVKFDTFRAFLGIKRGPLRYRPPAPPTFTEVLFISVAGTVLAWEGVSKAIRCRGKGNDGC